MRRLAFPLLCAAALLSGCAASGAGNLESLRQQTDRDYAAGHLQAAAAGYAKLTATVKNDPILWARLGNTQALLGQPAPASHAYAQALRLKPDFTAVRYNFAMLRLRQAQAQLIAATTTPDLPSALRQRIQAMQDVLAKLDIPELEHSNPPSP